MKTILKHFTVILLLALAFQSCSSSDDDNPQLDIDAEQATENKGFRLIIDTLNIKLDNLTLPTELASQTSPIAMDLNSRLLIAKQFIEGYAELTTIPEDTEKISTEDIFGTNTETHLWESPSGESASFEIVEFLSEFQFQLKIKNADNDEFEKVMDGYVVKFETSTEALMRFYEGGIEANSLQFIKNNDETEISTTLISGDERIFFVNDITSGSYRLLNQDVSLDSFFWSENGSEGFATANNGSSTQAGQWGN